MASKTFNLADGSESRSLSSGGKICIIVCVLVVVVVILGVGFWVYKTNYGGTSIEDGTGLLCSLPPPLDENGLSNWTHGADAIAYACFPGFYLEGQDNVLIAFCENGTWSLRPPACNSLPIRLSCPLETQGLTGNISMWQNSLSDPAFILGHINYSQVDRSAGHLALSMVLSKSSCNVTSSDEEEDTPPPEEASQDSLRISFNSSDLKAYNKAELRLNLIFVSANSTASLVVVTQEDRTFVLSNSLSLAKKRAALLDGTIDI